MDYVGSASFRHRFHKYNGLVVNYPKKIILNNKKSIFEFKLGETKRQLGKDLQRAALESRRRNPRKFQCPECPQKYTTNQKLKYHRMVHGGVKIQCNSCLKLLSSPTALRSHMKTVHKKDKFSASDGTLVRAVDDDRRDDEVLELEAADAAGNQPTGHVRLEQPISTDESAAFDNLLDHPK